MKLEEFPDRSADVKRWQDLLSRRSSRPKGYRGAAALDQFIEANILRLGLELACTNCTKKNWVGIGDLKEQITCERCLKAFAFPQGSLNFKNTPWRYRVIGPFSVPNYAAGAYSTILALNVFARRLASDEPNMTYTTGLEPVSYTHLTPSASGACRRFTRRKWGRRNREAFPRRPHALQIKLGEQARKSKGPRTPFMSDKGA